MERLLLEAGLSDINKSSKTAYKLKWAVLDSASYGVPQHRRRAIGVASRSGEEFVFPAPSHVEKPITAWDAIGDLATPDEGVLPLGTWATGLLPSIPEGGNYQWLTSHGGGEEVFGYRTRYWSFLLKLAKDRPSWTLSASAGPSTGPFHWSNRQLTVKERLRLQSFPDNWSLIGSTRAQVRMVGNAAPPLLAEVIGREIVRQLIDCDATYSHRPLMLRSRKRTIPEPTAPLGVPDHLRHLIGKKKSHPGAGLGPSPRAPASRG